MSDENGSTMLSRSGRSDNTGKLTHRLDIPCSEKTYETAVAMAALHGIPRAEFLRMMLERAMFGDWFIVQQSMGRLPLGFHGRNQGDASHE